MAKAPRTPENDQQSPVSSNPATASERSPERIAARAYEIYLERGGADGQDFDDWLAAERELSSGPSQSDRDE